MSLDAFLSSVEKRAFKTACFSTNSKADALDIVQEAMTKLVKHYRSADADDLPKLFNRILHNCIIDWHRANKRRKLFFFETEASNGHQYDDNRRSVIAESEDKHPNANPETMMARVDDASAVQRSIEQLPHRQQQAFLLREWEGLDVSETAFAMNCSKSSVKTHHARALKSLRQMLEPNHEQ